MRGYIRAMSEEWIPFFTAVAGAAAALAGLIIVSVASSVDRMIEIRAMASRAGSAIALLVVVTVIALAGLIPGQGDLLFGIEALVVALAGLAFAVDSLVRLVRARDDYGTGLDPWLKGGLGVLPGVALVIGAALIAAGQGAGLGWIAVGILLSFMSSVVNAWVVLVEIRR